ncbi:phage holin family protein [Asaia bogorensis]|uniref:phage holin family protein n=1 Tax=Asaia bogorensis TaxID=91915 RepID=UPI000EFC2CC2|nr:phage holin family protein [Asaia bogorensis]
MKVIDVGQEALQAQGEVLQRVAMRIGRRVAYFIVAAIFGLFALVSFHAVLWAFAYSVLHFSAFGAACSVFGLDLLFVVIFALLGTRNVADPVEFEARLRRDRKMIEFRQTLALSTLTGLLLGPVGRFTGKQLFEVLRNIFARR